MPELPEVESFRRYIDKTSLHKKIELVDLAAPSVLLDTKPAKLKKILEGNLFVKTFRHGKFLFIELGKQGSLLLHFGLTGDLVFIRSGKEEPPTRFVLRFHFSGGDDLYFTDTRKMGKIAHVPDVTKFIEKRKYGEDALQISEESFIKKLEKKRVAIKTALMDQKVVAGVGNEFSDEILFQTKIHPSSISSVLSKAQLKKIYAGMISVLSEAVKYNADRRKLEHYFFLENRRAGLKCPRCKGETEFKTIGGRSSYFCPRCQKLFK